MSQRSFTTLRRHLGKFALAAGFTSVMLAGGILVAAQDMMSTLPYGEKLVSMGDNVVSTYAFASDDLCSAMLSVMNDKTDEPVFMTLTETTTNSLVASLALPATGAMFRLPQGAYQYKLTVQHVGVDDPTMYWMQVEKDCSTLTAQSGQPMAALVQSNGGTQTVRVAVTDPNGQSFVMLPAGGADQSSTSTSSTDNTNGGGNNGGGNNGGGNNGGGNNGGGNNGGGNNGGGNNGGGNNGGGNNGGGLINTGITIIIRNELTGQLEDVLNIDIDAGLAINLPEGNHLIEIVNNTLGNVGLGLTLDGDVSLADIQVDVAAKLESNLIKIDAAVGTDLSADGLALNVNGSASVCDTSLLNVDATVGGTNGSTGSNGSLVDVNATVGGNGSSNSSNGSLVNVNATVGGNGSNTGSNGSLVDVNATVGGNGSSSNGSLVDVNASVNTGNTSAPVVDVNANVGGQTAPIVDVNATVNMNTSAPVVDVNANVGGQSAPIVDVNATVNTNTSAPVVDVNANVGGQTAPIVDVNASASSSNTSATVSVVSTPVVTVSTGSTGTNVNVGGIGVKLP